jgi:hypothetical protein
VFSVLWSDPCLYNEKATITLTLTELTLGLMMAVNHDVQR